MQVLDLNYEHSSIQHWNDCLKLPTSCLSHNVNISKPVKTSQCSTAQSRKVLLDINIESMVLPKQLSICHKLVLKGSQLRQDLQLSPRTSFRIAVKIKILTKSLTQSVQKIASARNVKRHSQLIFVVHLIMKAKLCKWQSYTTENYFTINSKSDKRTVAQTKTLN